MAGAFGADGVEVLLHGGKAAPAQHLAQRPGIGAAGVGVGERGPHIGQGDRDNVEAMTRVLKEIQAEGFVVDAAVLGGLAPYRVEHINRFGDYSLDLVRQVPPMQFETILI